jgi:hypothetical protein
MKVLREVGQFELNEGELAAKGLFNVTNTILLENTKDEGVSFWFDEEKKCRLMLMSDKDFVKACIQLAGNNINKYI